MLLIDAHEDIAWNMASFGRDYTRPVAETRRNEAGTQTPARNDDALLGYPEYRRGKVGLVIASLFAAPIRFSEGDWDKLAYRDAQEAYRIYNHQIDLYERLSDEHPNYFRLVRTRHDLEDVIEAWEKASDWPPPITAEQTELVRRKAGEKRLFSGNGSTPHPPEEIEPDPNDPGRVPDGPPVGLVISMEGREALRQVGELEDWYERGVRSIGPAWVGTRFCGGSREPGPITSEGFELLERMADLKMALDLTHMDEQAVLQALDAYPGQMLASHSNALSLLRGATGNRHLSDRVINGLLERNGVIGVVLFNTFLKAGWRKGDRREEVGLERVVAQIDYICQMAGDARHVGIGTDFDGGFGWQSVPHEIDTIADVHKLVPLLSEKGYTEEDIAAVFYGNWLDVLRRVMPESV